MKKTERGSKPGHITHGDIFDDLGFSPAETLEAKIKADIWQAIFQCIKRHKFTQTELATRLKVHQPDISNLLQGKIGRMSVARLIQFASHLDLDARIEVKPSRSRRVSLEASSAKPRKRSKKAQLAAV